MYLRGILLARLLAITHNYKAQPGIFPVPTTMTLDMVDAIAKSNPDMNLHLVSLAPFACGRRMAC
jgi:hypothetical protein